MSVPFAVADIIERVRTRADLPAFDSSTNVTDTMVLAMVQESARDLSAQMNDVDWFFVSTIDLVTTAGVPYISAPANMANIVRIVWNRDSSRVIPIEPARIDDLPAPPAATWYSMLPRYRLSGNLIEFVPTPTDAYAVNVRFATGAFIASASDTLFGHLGWDTWIVYNVCCIIRQRQDRDYSVFASERDRKLSEIMATSRRERGVVKRPRDVRGVLDPIAGRRFRWWP